jgi:hypothetical protein
MTRQHSRRARAAAASAASEVTRRRNKPTPIPVNNQAAKVEAVRDAVKRKKGNNNVTR